MNIKNTIENAILMFITGALLFVALHWSYQITGIIIVIAVVIVTLIECIKTHKDIPYDGLALLIGTVLVPITGLKAWEKKLENNA